MIVAYRKVTLEFLSLFDSIENYRNFYLFIYFCDTIAFYTFAIESFQTVYIDTGGLPRQLSFKDNHSAIFRNERPDMKHHFVVDSND